jgi:hypothetical protein
MLLYGSRSLRLRQNRTYPRPSSKLFANSVFALDILADSVSALQTSVTHCLTAAPIIWDKSAPFVCKERLIKGTVEIYIWSLRESITIKSQEWILNNYAAHTILVRLRFWSDSRWEAYQTLLRQPRWKRDDIRSYGNIRAFACCTGWHDFTHQGRDSSLSSAGTVVPARYLESRSEVSFNSGVSALIALLRSSMLAVLKYL